MVEKSFEGKHNKINEAGFNEAPKFGPSEHNPPKFDTQEYDIKLDDKKQPVGVIWVPYVTKNVSTSINGVTVWHSNKLINLWIKI